MARPKVDLPEPEAIRALIDGQGRLALRVTPGARVETVAVEQGRLVVRVRAKPSDGEANAAVMALVAKALGVPNSRLTLLKGATSREKLIGVSQV